VRSRDNPRVLWRDTMTLKITQANKAAVLEKLKAGRIDGAAMSGKFEPILYPV
jgi:hypothetical protein